MKKRCVPMVVSLLVLVLASGVAFAQQSGVSQDSSLITMFDRDKDGKLSTNEFPGNAERFDGMDKNKDGFIDGSEASMSSLGGSQRSQSRPSRVDKGPKVSEAAPPFKLTSLDGKQEFDLGEFGGKKPVILFFGSYT